MHIFSFVLFIIANNYHRYLVYQRSTKKRSWCVVVFCIEVFIQSRPFTCGVNGQNVYPLFFICNQFYRFLTGAIPSVRIYLGVNAPIEKIEKSSTFFTWGPGVVVEAARLPRRSLRIHLDFRICVSRQCHWIQLTILRRFSWPIRACIYRVHKRGLKPHSFIFLFIHSFYSIFSLLFIYHNDVHAYHLKHTTTFFSLSDHHTF